MWPTVAVIDFIVFMYIVPTVMLNALIAFMGGTYERVNETKAETMLMEKLSLILEFEAYMVRTLLIARSPPADRRGGNRCTTRNLQLWKSRNSGGWPTPS